MISRYSTPIGLFCTFLIWLVTKFLWGPLVSTGVLVIIACGLFCVLVYQISLDYWELSRIKNQSEENLANYKKAFEQRMASNLQHEQEYEIAYAKRIAEFEEHMQSYSKFTSPIADPEDVLHRLEDLNLDATAKVEVDGAITVVLRKKRETSTLIPTT